MQFVVFLQGFDLVSLVAPVICELGRWKQKSKKKQQKLKVRTPPSVPNNIIEKKVLYDK